MRLKLLFIMVLASLFCIKGQNLSSNSIDSTKIIDSLKIKALKEKAEKIKLLADSLNSILDSIDSEMVKIVKPAPIIEKPWNFGAKFSSTITQVTLNNWIGGGQNSVSLVGTAEISADYKKKNFSWENDIGLHYGIIRQGDNSVWWKNDDQQQLNVKLDKKAFKSWNYSMLYELRTQFSPGYNYPDDSTLISDLMAPGYLIASSGLDYKHKVKKFSFMAGPFTVKMTIVNNQLLADLGAFGVDPAEYDDSGNMITPGKKFRSEVGGFIKLKFREQILKNITFENNLELFSNYLNKPENIDVVWGTVTSIKILKYFSATLTTNLIYDDDVEVPVDRDGDGEKEGVGPRVQFEQMFGFGFTYKIK